MKSMFANIDGVRTPRPKKQDVKPQAFQLPPHAMIRQLEPTDRRIMWLIYHYPYFMNVFFMSDAGSLMRIPNSLFNKYALATAVLHDKGYIKHSWNRLKYKVTVKGHFFRLTTHPAFPTAAPLIGAIGVIITVLKLVL